MFVRRVGTARRFLVTNVKRFIRYVEPSCCVASSSWFCCSLCGLEGIPHVQLSLVDGIHDAVGGDMGDGGPCAVATCLLLHEVMFFVVEL